VPVTVVDEHGAPVGVTGRHCVTAPPRRLVLGGRDERDVLAWAGPWPVDARWWDDAAASRRARIQAVVGTADRRASGPPGRVAGTAVLLGLDGGRWFLEAVYD